MQTVLLILTISSVLLLPFLLMAAVRCVKRETNPLPYTIEMSVCLFLIWFYCMSG